jgi:polynucleotide 5'-kinase involved in rRNA processing
MPQELRYWDRVGFMVSKQQAEEVASRMNTATGKTLDEDLEDYVESSVDINAVLNEITILFENPPIDNQELSEDNQAIITMMQFEQGKKQFIMDRKAEGMELADAKQAYEFEKAKLVRVALDLPDPVEEEE